MGNLIEFVDFGDVLEPMQMTRCYGDTPLAPGLFVPPKRARRAAAGPSDAASPFMAMDSAAIEDADPEDTCGGVTVGGGKDGKRPRS